MRRCTYISIVGLQLIAATTVWAGPLSKVVDTVGNTARAVGDTVTEGAEKLTSDTDVGKERAEIDANARKSLDRLFKLNPKSRALYDKSYGYAVFDSRKSSFLISLGSSGGVAVAKSSGARTYMRMISGGANIGAGIQFFQNIFLFETRNSFDRFVNSGWEAGSAANANFGKDVANAEVRFVNGLAIYQLADTGINLSADISGTRYYRDKELN